MPSTPSKERFAIALGAIYHSQFDEHFSLARRRHLQLNDLGAELSWLIIHSCLVCTWNLSLLTCHCHYPTFVLLSFVGVLSFRIVCFFAGGKVWRSCSRSMILWQIMPDAVGCHEEQLRVTPYKFIGSSFGAMAARSTSRNCRKLPKTLLYARRSIARFQYILSNADHVDVVDRI